LFNYTRLLLVTSVYTQSFCFGYAYTMVMNIWFTSVLSGTSTILN